MVKQTVETLVNGGKASAAPPLGPALGPLGVNIGAVVAEINKKTADFAGMQVPVKVEVDSETKAFTISVGTPPTSQLIKQESGAKKGSGKAKEEFVANLSFDQILKISRMKESALTGTTMKERVKEVIGTCVSMGVTIEGNKPFDVMKAIDKGEYKDKFSA